MSNFTFSINNKIFFIIALLSAIYTTSNAQSNLKLGNNPGQINPSAAFEIESISKGLLLPRMTTAEMNAIASPATGLMIYNTDLNCIHYYFGGWKSQCDPANLGAWGILGNTGTNATNNFLGTTDNQDLLIKTNGAGRIRIGKNGHIALGNYNNQPIDNIGLLWGAGTYPMAFNLQDSISDFSSTLYQGMASMIKVKPASNWNGNVYAGNFDTHIPSDFTGNLGGAMIGYAGDVRHYGSGTVASLIAANNATANHGTGTVTNAYGWNGNISNYGAGTITNAYGVNSLIARSAGTITNGYAFYAPNVEATNAWGFYQVGTTNNNYFGGSTGIGINLPTNKLHVVATANPLRLVGLQSGVNADSVMTVDANGVVRQRSVASILLTGNAWLNGGNALTSPGVFGTTTAQPFSIITNGATRLTFGDAGTITQAAGGGQVTFTGNVDATNGFDVTGAPLTANAGSTLTGTTNINSTAAGTTNIGTTGGTNNIAGTTIVTGTTDLNTTGANPTNIGNALSTTNVTGPTNINTTGTSTTTIGTAAGTTNVLGTTTLTGTNNVVGTNNLNTTGSGTTNIGNALATTNVDGTNLNIPNLPVTTTPTTDQVVVVDATTGETKKISLANLVSADNGLTKTLNNIQLGGALTQVTDITTSATNTLAISGLQTGVITDNIVTSDATTGVLKKSTPTAFIQNNAWALLGNTNTNPAINFVGTTDNKDLNFRTNNAIRATITATGEVGIGVATPNSSLQVAGSVANTIRTITFASSVAQKTVSAADYTVVLNATAGAIAIDLPDPSTCIGRSYIIKKMDGVGTVTFDESLVLDLSSSFTTLTMASTYTIQSDGTQWLVVNRF